MTEAKKWTDDERDEAFDRGMETMQRVALELYRRGREPLLEELETVKRERDEAQARVLDAALIHADLVRERDEARAEVSRLQEDRDKWRDRYHAMRTDVGLSGDVEDEITCAYRRGAEAMREACARMEPYAYNLDDHLMISKWRSLVRGLPIPEDK